MVENKIVPISMGTINLEICYLPTWDSTAENALIRVHQ